MSTSLREQLNPAQWEAVSSVEGSVLVIAGAGSGKTRTIVYRLAHLVEQGVAPQSILLLTFTRKAAQEMLQRAETLFGHNLTGTQGGTFHSFAYQVLRRFPPEGFPRNFTIMDRPDAESVLKEVKGAHGVGKGDKSFPKIGAVLELIGKSRNKEMDLRDLLPREAFHLMPYADDFLLMADEYAKLKANQALMDYDDLLFHLETLLKTRDDVREHFFRQYNHIMVDEYQDTNLVQARLVELLAKGPNDNGNIVSKSVMAVGDDAQSIYAFRGANIVNIQLFPQFFPGTKIVKLEQNYRSTQPVLHLTNSILAGSEAHFRKSLWSEKTAGPLPRLYRPLSDRTQAKRMVEIINELLKTYQPNEIAVLFRAGYQSFALEMELSRAGMPFAKYGGLRYAETAHVKDMLSFVRLVRNPLDLPAWQRAVSHVQGVGPKTSGKIFTHMRTGDTKALDKAASKWPELGQLIKALDMWRAARLNPAGLLERILEFYRPIFEQRYADDYPRREAALEELQHLAAGYEDLDMFLADISLENPEPGADEHPEDKLTLSTIHSAKGLEWDAVLIMDLVEDRFPSRHALNKPDDLEEERRLMYVACTRAREFLGLFAPCSVTPRGSQFSDPATPSPFVREIPAQYYDEYRESYSGMLQSCGGAGQACETIAQPSVSSAGDATPLPPPPQQPGKLGFCTHKIFGRGKIIKAIPPDKYQVNFPDFGLKVIVADYLQMED